MSNQLDRMPVHVPLWHRDRDGQVVRARDAEHWQSAAAGAVRCTLCYRKCHLADGEDGPCGFRGNRRGTMQLHDHGVVTSCVRQIRGFQVDPFLTYKPGATSLFLGGVRCTARCTFCMSTDLVWRPEGVPWGLPTTDAAPTGSKWYGHRVLMHPVDAVANAQHWECSQIVFGINEPTLSIEWTLDTARLAREAGLDVCVETNGFTSPAAIRKLAPYVNAVDVGVKGSADPEFYAQRMKSPGAVPHVLDALKEWRRAGVHLIVGDLIAPPYMQDDATFERNARDFYTYVAEHLGPITAVLTTVIQTPGPAAPGKSPGMLVGRGSKLDYLERLDKALDLAHTAGLPYAHTKRPIAQTIDCHACGGVLLRLRESCGSGLEKLGQAEPDCVMAEHFCPWWTHEQHVTDSRCDHCGAAVPIVTLPPEQLDAERARVRQSAHHAGLI